MKQLHDAMYYNGLVIKESEISKYMEGFLVLGLDRMHNFDELEVFDGKIELHVDGPGIITGLENLQYVEELVIITNDLQTLQNFKSLEYVEKITIYDKKLIDTFPNNKLRLLVKLNKVELKDNVTWGIPNVKE